MAGDASNWVLSDGWSVTPEAGNRFNISRAFPVGGDVTLDLGEIPDRAIVTVAGNRSGLTVNAVRARWVTLKVAVPSRLKVDCKFDKIYVVGTSYGVVSVTCEIEPNTLILQPTADNCTFSLNGPRRIVVDAHGKRLTLESDRIGSISGTASELLLGSGDWGRVAIRARVRTSGEAKYEAIECTGLEASGGSLTVARTLQVAEDLSFVGHSSHGFITADFIEGRSISGFSIRCRELVAHGSIFSQPRLQQAQVEPQFDETDLLLSPPRPPAGSSYLEVSTAKVDGVIFTPELRIVHGDGEPPSSIAAGTIVATAVAAQSEPDTIIADQLWAETVTMPEGSIEVGRLTVTSKLVGMAVTSRQANVSGSIDVKNFVVHDLHLTGSASGRIESDGGLTLHPGATAQAVTFMGSRLHILPGASIERLLHQHGAALIDGTVGDLSIDGSAAATTVELADHSGEITLVGDVTLATKSPASEDAPPWSVRLNGNAKLTLGAHRGPILLDDPHLDRHELTIITQGTNVTTIDLKRDNAPFIDLCASGPTTVSSNNPVDRAARISLCGPEPITLVGTYDEVIVTESAETRLPANTHVRNWQGHAKFKELAGSAISVRTKHAGGQSPAVLKSIPTDDGLAPTARLVGFDITKLTYQEVTALGGIEVFIPDHRSVVEYAKEKEPDATRVSARAQWIANLAQQTERHTLTGSGRTALGWSSARLHHKYTYVQSKPEWAARLLHRAVGYGHKITPPLLTWLATTFVITGLMVRYVHNFDWDCGRSLARIGFYPLDLLRYSAGSKSVFAPIPDWVRPIAIAAVTIPLALTLLAVRNFFRTDRSK